MEAIPSSEVQLVRLPDVVSSTRFHWYCDLVEFDKFGCIFSLYQSGMWPRKGPPTRILMKGLNLERQGQVPFVTISTPLYERTILLFICGLLLNSPSAFSVLRRGHHVVTVFAFSDAVNPEPAWFLRFPMKAKNHFTLHNDVTEKLRLRAQQESEKPGHSSSFSNSGLGSGLSRKTYHVGGVRL